MKRITLLVLLFSFSFVFAVMSDDLGELAKKEKARREALEKAGKNAKVFTNNDIDKLKSEVAMESKATEGEATETEPVEEQSEQPDYSQNEYQYNPPVEGQEYVPDPAPEQQAEDPFVERDKKIRDLEDQIGELEKKAKDARDNVGAGGLWHSRNTGDQYRTAREAEEKQEKLDQQIDSTKKGQQDPNQVEPTPPPPVEEYVPPQEQLPPEEPAATEEEPPF